MSDNIDLKAASVEKLESICYKLIVQMNQLQAALNQVQAELQERNGKEEPGNVPES